MLPESPQVQIDDAYRAIGRYVVQFSRLIGEMRHLASRRVAQGAQNPDLAELLLGEATATPISNAFFGLCRMMAGLDKEEQKVAAKLRSEVKLAIEMRNDFAHGDWWVGLPASDDPATLRDTELVRILPIRTEGPEKSVTLSTQDLDAMAERLMALLTLVLEFGHLALGLPVLRLDPDGESHTSVREFRVRDVLAVHGGKRDTPAVVVRSGPKADAVYRYDYSSSG